MVKTGLPFFCSGVYVLPAKNEGEENMGKRLRVVHSVRSLRNVVQDWRHRGKTIALVPTMGALHDGHLSLVKLARKHANRVVVSIFVNPIQFAPHEDLSTYPRDEDGDRQILGSVHTDLLYMPEVGEMYPPDFSTRIDVSGVSRPLEGESRPHHFAGVATVVTKLFLQCLPDVAVFGEKDYQQLQVIRRLVEDLDFPVGIVGAPVARADSGLALSSRNAYLSDEQRQKIAPELHKTIKAMATGLENGQSIDEATAEGRKRLEAAGFQIGYLEVRHAETLLPFDGQIDAPARVLVAAVLGKTRLIDNVAV
jgi:pantoate--beta-alanine ligase